MAVAITQDGEAIRVEWRVPWYARLPALPFLAASLYFLNIASHIVRDDLGGLSGWQDDWSGLLICLGFGLAVAVPGLVLVTYRYSLDLDKVLRRIVVTRKFGPLKFRGLRQLSDFNFISITDNGEGDPTLVMYCVNVCGGKGVIPIMISEFSKREDANDFARQLGKTLKLPSRDYVGTEPDDSDADM